MVLPASYAVSCCYIEGLSLEGTHPPLVGAMEAISAMDSTTVKVPRQTNKVIHIAPKTRSESHAGSMICSGAP